MEWKEGGGGGDIMWEGEGSTYTVRKLDPDRELWEGGREGGIRSKLFVVE